MEQENDSASVSTETTEETQTETTTTENQSNDFAELKELIQSQQNDIASLKRSLKKATKETKSETPEKTTSKDNSVETELLQKAFLRSAQITDKEEVQLALETANKWGVTVDALVDDEDFKVKLEKHRTAKANVEATSNVKGDKSKTSAKDTVEYWTAKGQPPTPEQVPDRKKRAEIVRSFLKNAKTNGKQFYND